MISVYTNTKYVIKKHNHNFIIKSQNISVPFEREKHMKEKVYHHMNNNKLMMLLNSNILFELQLHPFQFQ